MILILDANAVIPNPELTGSAWADITAAIDDGVLTVIAPRIVVAEITGRVRSIRRSQRPRTEGLHGLPPRVREAVQTARQEVEAWADAYDASTFLHDAGVVIRPTPTISHDVLAQRAIDRTRPFNDKGGGYRDALHWYTVLDVIAQHPDEDVVLLSNDNGYKNKQQDDLHESLRVEAEEALEAGEIALCQDLKAFVPPRKFAGQETRNFPSRAHVRSLMKALFPNGTLHAPELWSKLQLDDPVDADVIDPGEPEVVFSFVRNLVGGGMWYRTRLRLMARVVFDWIDWAGDDEAEGSEEKLDVTAWYTVTNGEFTVEPDRTDLQPAPIYTSSLSFLDPTVVRGLTSSVFAGWKSQQFHTSVGLGADLLKRSKINWSMPAANIGAEVARRAFTTGFDLNSLGAAISRGSFLGGDAAESFLSGIQGETESASDGADSGTALEDGIDGRPDTPAGAENADQPHGVSGSDEPRTTDSAATDTTDGNSKTEEPEQFETPDGSSPPS